jgi:hypothetical protein
MFCIDLRLLTRRLLPNDRGKAVCFRHELENLSADFKEPLKLLSSFMPHSLDAGCLGVGTPKESLYLACPQVLVRRVECLKSIPPAKAASQLGLI